MLCRLFQVSSHLCSAVNMYFACKNRTLYLTLVFFSLLLFSFFRSVQGKNAVPPALPFAAYFFFPLGYTTVLAFREVAAHPVLDGWSLSTYFFVAERALVKHTVRSSRRFPSFQEAVFYVTQLCSLDFFAQYPHIAIPADFESERTQV